jgi:hypothetical protein
MKFRWGLLLGFAIGYLFGAKAGRERYDQIMDAISSFRQTERGQQLESAATNAAQQAEAKAAEGVAKVTELVRERTSQAGGGSGTSSF